MVVILVDECPVGHIVDAAVAMARGWHIGPYDLDRGFKQPVWIDQDGIFRYAVQLPGMTTKHHWCPSIHIEQAWELAEELERVSLYMPNTAIWQEYRASCEYTAEHLPSPDMEPWESIIADGDTANLALMRVYLKAKNVMSILVPDDFDLSEVPVEYVRLVKRGNLSEFLSSVVSGHISQDGEKHLVVMRWDRAIGLGDLSIDGKAVDVQFESPEGIEQGTMWDWVISPTGEGHVRSEKDE